MHKEYAIVCSLKFPLSLTKHFSRVEKILHSKNEGAGSEHKNFTPDWKVP